MSQLQILGIGLVALVVVNLLLTPSLWSKLFSGIASLKSGATTTSSDPTKPSFDDMMHAMSAAAQYKANCKDQPEYSMAMAALKQLEAST